MSGFATGTNSFLASPHVEKILAPNPTTERGNSMVINAHPTAPLLIYPSGKSVVVKNYLDPSECFIYRGHNAVVHVAKFSPNGFWVASGDTTGKVRVWAWDNPEHNLKIEVNVFAGAILDLDWDCESKKIVAVGNGSSIMAKCFIWDTGNSSGEMVGHNKRVLSVAYKPTRPFRIMSGGEDMRCLFFCGPPFKYDHSNETHKNFVNVVRYSSNGNKIVSVGADKKVQLYDGTSGLPLGEIPNAHEGGVYGASFSPSGANFVTASADKTIKVWDSETLALVQTLSVSSDPQLGDAQVSVLWHKDSIISVSLNGSINICSIDSPAAPQKVISANQTSISSIFFDKESQLLFSGSLDGVICSREVSGSYESYRLDGADKKHISRAAHNGKVAGIAAVGGQVVSVGWDDRIRWASIDTKKYHSDQELAGQPIALEKSSTSDLLLVITNIEISLYRGSEKVSVLSVSSLKYSPTCGSVLGEEEVAIGGSDNKTHIYNISSGFTFTETNTIETRSAVSSLAYHPSGQLLAIGDTGRQIEVYERGTWEAKVKGRWVYHTSKITTLSWSPSGNYLASGSLDENIFIWSLHNPLTKLQLQFSHPGGVSETTWASEEKLISAGNDHAVVIWKIPAFSS